MKEPERSIRRFSLKSTKTAFGHQIQYKFKSAWLKPMNAAAGFQPSLSSVVNRAKRMMKISIIAATATDAPEILALQKTAYQSEAELYHDWTIPPLTQTLSQIEDEFSTKMFIKAVQSDRIVGSVRASLDGGTCAIGRLIVHPDYQRKGIGTQLLLRMETILSQAERFELFTGSQSRGNIRLYERLGYRIFREESLSSNVRLIFLEKRR